MSSSAVEAPVLPEHVSCLGARCVSALQQTARANRASSPCLHKGTLDEDCLTVSAFRLCCRWKIHSDTCFSRSMAQHQASSPSRPRKTATSRPASQLKVRACSRGQHSYGACWPCNAVRPLTQKRPQMTC